MTFQVQSHPIDPKKDLEGQIRAAIRSDYDCTGIIASAVYVLRGTVLPPTLAVMVGDPPFPITVPVRVHPDDKLVEDNHFANQLDRLDGLEMFEAPVEDDIET